MDKSRLRKDMLLRRNQLDFQTVALASQQIRANLWPVVNWSSIRTLHMYTSQNTLNEVDTDLIYQKISKTFPEISITKGNPSKHALIPAKQFDVIFVPLVAFDDTCHRIGFGGGWYDRFLSMQLSALKIGLAYELQKTSVIAAEAHDEPLDIIVTETNVYTNKNALPK